MGAGCPARRAHRHRYRDQAHAGPVHLLLHSHAAVAAGPEQRPVRGRLPACRGFLLPGDKRPVPHLNPLAPVEQGCPESRRLHRLRQPVRTGPARRDRAVDGSAARTGLGRRRGGRAVGRSLLPPARRRARRVADHRHRRPASLARQLGASLDLAGSSDPARRPSRPYSRRERLRCRGDGDGDRRRQPGGVRAPLRASVAVSAGCSSAADRLPGPRGGGGPAGLQRLEPALDLLLVVEVVQAVELRVYR